MSDIQVERVQDYNPEVAAGIGALFPYLYPEHDGHPIEEALFRQMIASPSCIKLITRHDEAIVGAATVNLLITDLYRKAHFDNFVTHPDVRGQGYGRALWAEAIIWAKEKGASKLTLVSSREPAIEFYLHHGAIKRPDTYFNVPF